MFGEGWFAKFSHDGGLQKERNADQTRNLVMRRADLDALWADFLRLTGVRPEGKRGSG